MRREEFVPLFRWRCAFPDAPFPLTVEWLVEALGAGSDGGLKAVPGLAEYDRPPDPELDRVLVGFRHRNQAGREAAVRWFLEG